MSTRGKHTIKRPVRSAKKNSLWSVLLIVLAVSALVGGITIAFLTTDTPSVRNTFDPASVPCEVTEDFDGTQKSNIKVKNDGNVDAYLRVRFASYWLDGENITGKSSPAIPTLSLGEGWVKYGEYYYYTSPVKPGDSTLTPVFTAPIALSKDGNLQPVVEVMAESIQSTPAKAISEAWGVVIAPNSVTAYTA